MPSKISDTRLTQSIALARKERAALDVRHERAKSQIESYDADVKEVDARIEYLSTIATQRGLALEAPADDVVDAQVVDDDAAPTPS